MGKPFAKRTIKAMAYIKEHPDAPVAAIAAKFNMALSQVYGLRKRVREQEATDKVNKGLNKLTWTVTSTDAREMIAAQEERTDPWSAKSVDAVLDERAKDYGKFIEGAEIMQMLKRLVHNYIEQRGTQLAFDQREAIDMIIHKLGRIINGNPDKVDHWTDIAGYAKLVADRLEGNAR